MSHLGQGKPCRTVSPAGIGQGPCPYRGVVFPVDRCLRVAVGPWVPLVRPEGFAVD